MIKIRNFQPGDEARMKEIAPRAFAVYARFGIDKTLPKDKTEEFYRKEVEGYAQQIAVDTNLGILIAEEAGKLLGYIVLWIDQRRSKIYGFIWGSIASLAVDPEFHGRGIGSLLIAEGLKWLKNKNVKYAEVWTDQNNIAAIRAYEKNGFRVIYSGIALSQYLY